MIKKVILLLFLGGFVYHVVSFLFHFGIEKLFHTHTGIHFLSAIFSLVVLLICYKIIHKKDKTSDNDHHRINKIR